MKQGYAGKLASTRGGQVVSVLAMVTGLISAPPALAAGLGDMLGALAGRSAGGYSESGALEDAVARLAVQFNSGTPKDLNNDVRLDSVTARKLELTYHYTILGKSASEVPQEVFNTRLAPLVKERMCQDAQSLRLLKSGAHIGYLYRGRDGNEIGKLSFAQRDCSGAG